MPGTVLSGEMKRLEIRNSHFTFVTPTFLSALAQFSIDFECCQGRNASWKTGVTIMRIAGGRSRRTPGRRESGQADAVEMGFARAQRQRYRLRIARWSPGKEDRKSTRLNS